MNDHELCLLQQCNSYQIDFHIWSWKGENFPYKLRKVQNARVNGKSFDRMIDFPSHHDDKSMLHYIKLEVDLIG